MVNHSLGTFSICMIKLRFFKLPDPIKIVLILFDYGYKFLVAAGDGPWNHFMVILVETPFIEFIELQVVGVEDDWLLQECVLHHDGGVIRDQNIG